jgi:hypothetical protein
VSGVGLNHDPEAYYVVPPSYSARWDDEGYQFPATDELPMMRESPFNGRHGFILHALCYSLLQKFFYPREVPVARILEVCKSVPFQHLGLSWGHDYGGTVCINQKNQYLWEGQDLNGVKQPKLADQRANPWDIPELKELLQGAQLGLPEERKINFGNAMLSNCFTRLPREILGYIVMYLSINGVKTLAQTSKELAMIIPSGLGQSFWASRFQTPFELSFIFEAQKYKDKFDWRSLYFQVIKAMHYSQGLQNRKRIWSLIRSPLSELAWLRWNGSLALDANKDQIRWKEVCGNHQPLERVPRTAVFYTGCRRFYTQRTFIPILLRQVVISTILIRDTTYITGIRFIPNTGPGVSLGYVLKEESITDQFVDATDIQGFILAVGSRGIQALQFITCVGQLSRWFGSPDGLPKTRRLTTSKSIAALEAGFDVRITSFNIITSLLTKRVRGLKWLAWRLQRRILAPKIQ